MTGSPTVTLGPRSARRSGGVWSGFLLYGLLLPPLVWAIQLYLNFGLGSHACYPNEAPRATFVQGWERTWSLLLVVNLLCAAICAIGLLASGYSWHRLRDEYPGEGKVDWRRLPFPGTLEILRRRRGDDERECSRPPSCSTPFTFGRSRHAHRPNPARNAPPAPRADRVGGVCARNGCSTGAWVARAWR